MSLKNVCFVFYELNEDVLSFFESNFNIKKYCYILHDKDFDANGELLKPHYHCCIEFYKPINKSLISNAFNIHESLVQTLNNFDSYVIYMTHLEFNDKHHYSISDIVSKNVNLNAIIELFFSNVDDEFSALDMIFNYIGSENRTFRDVFKFCKDHYLLKVYKSYYFVIRDIIKEK